MKLNRLVLILLSFILSVNTISADVLGYNLFGRRVYAESTETDGIITLNSAELMLVSDFNRDIIIFPTIKLSADMELLEDSVVELEESLEFITTNGFVIEVTALSFKTEGELGPGLYLKGVINIPIEGASKDLIIPSDGYSLYLDDRESLTFGSLENINFDIYGLYFRANTMEFGAFDKNSYRKGLIFKDVSLIQYQDNQEVPNSNPVIFPQISIYMSGELNEIKTSRVGDLYIDQMKLDSRSLQMKDGMLLGEGFLYLPGVFSNNPLFTKYYFDESGNITLNNPSRYKNENVSKVLFRFNNRPNINRNQFLYRNVLMSLPNCFDNEMLNISGLTIEPSGFIGVEGIGSQTLDGNSYNITNIKGDPNLFIFQGDITLKEGESSSFDLFYNTKGFIEKILLTDNNSVESTLYELPEDSELKFYSAFNHNNYDYLNTWVENRSVDIEVDDLPILIDRILQKDSRAINWLMDNNADVNVQYKGKTALYYALELDDLSILEKMISRGADASIIPDEKSNPILYTLSKRNFEALDLLLDTVCNFEVTNSSSKSMFDMFCNIEDVQLIRKAITKGLPVKTKLGNPIERLIWSNDYEERLKLYIELGFSYNDISSNGETILDFAIDKKKDDFVKSLSQYIPIEELKGDKFSKMLETTISYGLFKTAEFLLESGVSAKMNYTLLLEAPPELMELAINNGLQVPIEKAFINKITLDKQGKHKRLLTGLMYHDGQFQSVIESLKSYNNILNRYELVRVTESSTNDFVSMIPADYFNSESKLLLKYNDTDELYLGLTKPDLKTLNRMDCIISKNDYKNEKKHDLVISSKSNDTLLDFYPPNSMDDGAVLFKTSSNNLYIQPVNSDKESIKRVPLIEEGTVIDGSIIKTDSDYLYAVLKVMEDHFQLTIIKGDEQFSYDFEKKSSLNRDSKILIEKNGDSYTCIITTPLVSKIFSINTNDSVDIRSVGLIRTNNSKETVLVSRKDQPLLLTLDSKGVSVFELGNTHIPTNGFLIPIKKLTEGLGAAVTPNGGLGIVTNDRSNAYFIKLDETLSGVKTETINLDRIVSITK